jgi:periplasmic protein TonB
VITSGKMTSSSAQSRDNPEQGTAERARLPLDGGNIILFSRPGRASAAPPIVLGAEDRPAPWRPQGQSRALMPVFFLCAMALHAGLYALERKPAPVPSIGEVSIVIDIVLGSQLTAGLASTPSPAASPERAGEADTAEAPKADASATDQTTAAQVQESQAPTQSQSLTRDPEPPSTTPAAEPVSRATVPAVSRSKATVPKPTQKNPEPRAKPQREARLAPAESGRARTAATPSTPSSGAGRGRSDTDSNYPGRVYAHLARYQQRPDARGEQGVARVTISIDGSGRVTGVRLAGTSGNAAFDREAQAIVRRASPLPAPPSGRPLTLGWSVSFR